jgi:hypothetical protein
MSKESITSKSANKLGVKMEAQILLLEQEL